MSSHLSVSIVIPAFNEENLLRECIVSVSNQTMKAMEIIVVDNNSTDATRSVAEQCGARVVSEKRQGITYARTAGFNAAKGDIIGRIDADTYLRNDWVETVVRTFEHDKNLIGITGSTALYRLGKTFMGRWLFYIFLRKSVEMPMRVTPWLFGHNMAVRKSAWQKIKHNISLGDKDVNEDLDITLHLRKFGKLRYVHGLVASIHAERQLLNPKKIAAYSKATKHTLKRHKA